MKNKKLCAALMAAAFGFGFGFAAEMPLTDAATRAEIAQISVNKKGTDFKYWNKDAASYQALTAYMKDVTNPKSKNFIPKEDRIAVYDMDGTFLCETAPYYFDGMLFLNRTLHDSDYKAAASDREFAQGLEKFIRTKEPGDKLGSSAPHQAAVFEGMGYPEYTAYVRHFMETPVEGLTNLKWGEAFYLPMVETIQYLQNNDFQVYVVSGSERQLVRVLVCDILHIPENRIIGTDIEIKATHQGEADGLDYAFKKGDSLERGKFVIKNLQMNKTAAIAREIGKQPVLAFGNSSGDTSMLNYTVNDNKYKSAAFFLLCDDLERELGDSKKADKCRKLAEENGWVPVSMRDDFKTIYGENVTRAAAQK